MIFNIKLIAICFLLSAFILPLDVSAEEVGSRVAFFVEHEGGLQVVDARTGEISPINVGMMNIGNLAYSHTRDVLVFEGAKEYGNPKSIYAYDSNNGNIKRLNKPISYKDAIYRPEFHPNGNYLYALNYGTGILRYSFASGKWEKMEIVNTDEVNLQRISLSRSGNMVALSPARFEGFLIGTLDDHKITVIRTILTEFSCTSPRWIDDKVIIFAGREAKGTQYLWKFNLDTGILEQLTKEPLGTRDFLDVSTDGSSIVFTATDSSYEWRLWTIGTNGEGLKPLTRTGLGHLSPVWMK